jgi:hypothetical protein
MPRVSLGAGLTVGLPMGVIDTAREVVKIVRQIDNFELNKKLLDLQTELMALVDENTALKKRLEVSETLVFRANAYFRGDDGPFCSRCWDADTRLVRLHKAADSYPQCPACKTTVVPPDEQRFTIR